MISEIRKGFIKLKSYLLYIVYYMKFMEECLLSLVLYLVFCVIYQHFNKIENQAISSR